MLRVPFVLANILFLLGWILPNIYLPWLTFYQEFLFFLGGWFLLLALLPVSRVVVVPEFFFLIALSFIPVIQYWLGVIYFSGDVWVVFFYLFGFALAFCVGLNFKDVGLEWVLKIFSSLFVLASVVSIWIALRQAFSLSGSIWVVDLPLGARLFANMAQPNNLATLCCLGLAGVFYLYEKRLFGAFVSVVLSLFILLGVALTQSRMPIISFFMLLIFAYMKSGGEVRVRFWALPALMASYAGSLFLLYWVGDAFVGYGFLGFLSFSDSAIFQERLTSLVRFDMWSQLLYAAKAGGWWGYGWGQVSIAQVYASIESPVSIMTAYSHNLIIDLFIWNGFFVGSFVAIMFAAWLVVALCGVRTVEGFFCFLVLGFIGVHAMLEYPLAYAFFLIPFGIFLGVLRREVFWGGVGGAPRYYLLLVLVVSFSFLSVIWNDYSVVERENRKLRFEVAGLSQVDDLAVGSGVVFLNQLVAYIEFARAPAVKGMTDEDLLAMRKIVHRYPYASSLFRYSLALAVNEKFDLASEQMSILRGLHGDESYREGILVFENMQEKYPELRFFLRYLKSVGSER